MHRSPTVISVVITKCKPVNVVAANKIGGQERQNRKRILFSVIYIYMYFLLCGSVFFKASPKEIRQAGRKLSAARKGGRERRTKAEVVVGHQLLVDHDDADRGRDIE